MKKSLVTGLITLGLAAMLSGCGSSGKTIIDKVAYNTDGTMVAEAKKYMDSKDLIYEEKVGIHNTVADKFLGYRAYYDIDADDYYIYLTFDSEDELTKASKDVKKYFESKEDKDYKKSDLSELVEEKPEIWQEIFDGTTGNVYVVDYKDNKDDSFDYEAVLYCTMSDLDAAKEANGYVMGDLNTYIAISVKGAKGVTTDSINPMASSYEPVMETDSAATVESIETIETAENVDEHATVDEAETLTNDGYYSEETGDIGLVIADIEEVDKEVGAWLIENTENEASISYVKLPTKEGILIYKTIFNAPVYEGYLIYYLNGKTSYIQVSWQSTQTCYVEQDEVFIGSESYTMDTYNTHEYGIVDGVIKEIRETDKSIESYNGTDLHSKWMYYDTLDEAIVR